MSKQDLTYIEMNTADDFECFNFREKLKIAKKPYDYFKEIKDLDFEQLASSDRFFLQDFGIYNNELNDEEFTLRLRFPAGRISNKSLLLLANIAKEYNLQIILTARAGIQLHGLQSNNILEVFTKINNDEISTYQSFGDNIRNITSDIFDGVGKYNIIEVYSYIEKMQSYILNNKEYLGLLPRRLSIGISGSYANVNSFFASDIYFALAKKDDIYGFNVYLGGKNTQIAQEANIFLPKDDLVDFFIAFIEVFNKYGLRFDRNNNRLFHLIEKIGMEKLKEYLQIAYKKQWQTKGETLLEKVNFSEFEKLKNGKYSFCYRSLFARIEASELHTIAAWAIKDNLQIRLGTDQQIYLFNLQVPNVPIVHYNGNRTMLACAGSDFCPYAYWNIKDEIQSLPLVKIENNNILVGFSGCLKGCPKHEHSDIGLVGLKSDLHGKREKTARIYLGGLYTFGEATARIIFDAIPLNALKELLEIIIDEYEKSTYSQFELFSKNLLNTFSTNFLSSWFLAKYKTKEKVYLENNITENKLFKKNFSNFPFTNLSENNNFDNITKILYQELWFNEDTQENKKLKNTYILKA
ncbi:MAG: nitrite/sulfite reductase [Aliarcobacter sp.]|nr:nitrite/sulfite reductase [Aliarcobacter sp.]